MRQTISTSAYMFHEIAIHIALENLRASESLSLNWDTAAQRARHLAQGVIPRRRLQAYLAQANAHARIVRRLLK